MYDIIVMGAGSAGLSVSLFLNEVGLKVLLIDRADERIGGECLNDGCVPSKALLHLARMVHQAKVAEKLGLAISGELDIEKVMTYIHSQQNIIRAHENAQYLRKQGLEVVLGKARFHAPTEVAVDDMIYKAKRIVLATGSAPRKLKVPGVDLVKYYDNENVFDLQNLPTKLLVVGGGAIGVEIGQALHRLGSEVILVHDGPHLLEHDDPAVADILLQQLQKEGIRFILNAEVKSFATPNKANVETKDGERSEIDLDAVFVSIGREIKLDDLALEKAGIEYEGEKIKSNKYLQTTNSKVFVCGDVADLLQFSHVAEQHARLLLYNFFSPFKKKLSNDHISWVTFTDPEIATFGLNEKQLKEQGIDFDKLTLDFDEDDRAITDDYRYGKLILYIRKSSFFRKEKILGGTMIAPYAGEIVQELILANYAGISTKEIFNKIYPYPTASRVNQQILTRYRRKNLGDTTKQLLQFLYKIM